MKEFSKIEDFNDDDIIVGKAVIQRSVKVIEIVSRLTALNENCIYYKDLIDREPTEENMLSYSSACEQVFIYSERLYSPVI